MDDARPEPLRGFADPAVLWDALRSTPLRIGLIEPDDQGRFVLAGVDQTGTGGPPTQPGLIGRDVAEVFDPGLVRHLRVAHREGRPLRVHTPIDLPDGTTRVIDASIVPLPDGRILVFTYDLTESVSELERAREYSSAILRASPDRVWVLAHDLTIRHYAGPDDPDLARHPVGRNLAELYPAGVVERTRALVERTLTTGELQTMLEPYIRGEGRMFEARVVPLGADEVLAVLRDVTDLYQSRRAAEHRAEIDALSVRVLRDLFDLVGERLVAAAESALGEVARFIGADAATLGRRVDESRFERLFVWNDPSVASAFADAPQIVPVSSLATAFMNLAFGDPIVIRSLDEVETAPEREMLERLGARSVLALPLPSADGLVAYMTFYWMHRPMPDLEPVMSSIRSVGVTLLAAARRSEAERDRQAVAESLEHALDALRASEERFRLMSRATNDVLWDWDLNTDARWWGEGITTVFGYDRAELEPTIESWERCIHPDDVGYVVTSVRAAIESGARSWAMEYRFLHRSGRALWVLDRGEILHGADGRPVRMVGGMRDISDRRRAEDLLRDQARLLDAATDIIYARDLEHRVTYWNRSAERTYGWTAEEVHGRSVLDLMHTEPDRFDAAMADLLRDGEWSGEFRQRRADGSDLVVEARWTLVRDEVGRPRSVLAINTDVTERRRWEAQILRSQRMESIGTLAGGIAHDLNNVLTPILMSTELLQIDEPDPDRRATLATIETAAQRGADLVRQVLSFARGTGGRVVEVGVDALFAELAAFVRETFPRNISVRIDDPAEELHVAGDPTQLSQVLLNLCVNARDAMPDGGSLVVRAERRALSDAAVDAGVVSDEGDYVVISVSDTGAGIPADITERIFEPFFTTKDHGVGTGLGLATATAIVASHEGFLEFESEVGVGTTFFVYLPLAGTGRRAHPSSQDPAHPRGDGEVVLVVDDEDAVLATMRQVLKAHGYRVLVAASGDEALDVVRAADDPIDVVITDLMMPGMDGIETATALRALQPDIGLVAGSGVKTPEAVARAEAAGIHEFLAKPYATSTLLTTLRAVLARSAPR